MQKKVVISGGSGLIGKSLSQLLIDEGFEVCWLTRNPKKDNSFKQFYWNPLENDIDEAALKNTDIVINLAGAGIADKLWTPSRKIVLFDSRVKAIEVLHQSFKKLNYWPKKFITASAIGFYGSRKGEYVNEFSVKGEGFLSDLCEKWEQTADLFANEHVFTTKLRFGIVLAKNGGSLPVFQRLNRIPWILLPNGKQMISWIHINDLLKIILNTVKTDQYSEVVNVVSPNPVSLEEMIKSLNMVQNKKRITTSMPAFPVRLIAGDMSEIVLSDQHVIPEKLKNAGFIWDYPELIPALRSLL